jgi:hypothetical protein
LRDMQLLGSLQETAVGRDGEKGSCLIDIHNPIIYRK